MPSAMRWGISARARVLRQVSFVLFCHVTCRSGGSSAYTLFGDVADELDDGAIVEVGSDRGEGSTGFLSALANRFCSRRTQQMSVFPLCLRPRVDVSRR